MFDHMHFWQFRSSEIFNFMRELLKLNGFELVELSTDLFAKGEEGHAEERSSGRNETAFVSASAAVFKTRRRGSHRSALSG